ncbi:hypothetical protein [Pseudoclavibacter sp. JSM 162008]|uniref:hypothetical protein n=1 Tax=Pseudoclavibacter sp. JSM 162008 TaxID=3229855 RepID=UPI003523F244
MGREQLDGIQFKSPHGEFDGRLVACRVVEQIEQRQPRHDDPDASDEPDRSVWRSGGPIADADEMLPGRTRSTPRGDGELRRRRSARVHPDG